LCGINKTIVNKNSINNFLLKDKWNGQVHILKFLEKF